MIGSWWSVDGFLAEVQLDRPTTLAAFTGGVGRGASGAGAESGGRDPCRRILAEWPRAVHGQRGPRCGTRAMVVSAGASSSLPG